MVHFLDRFRSLRVDHFLWDDKLCDRDRSGVGIHQRPESKLILLMESD